MNPCHTTCTYYTTVQGIVALISHFTLATTATAGTSNPEICSTFFSLLRTMYILVLVHIASLLMKLIAIRGHRSI